MKNLTYIILLIFVFSACDSIHIFKPESAQQVDGMPASDTELLIVQVAGGFLNDARELRIFADGRTTLTIDQQRSEINIVLSNDQMTDIKTTFESNHFEKLNDSYAGFEATDYSIYQIYYQSDQTGKTVVTDMSNNPQDLQNIIDKLNSIMDTILNNGLKFILVVDKTIVKKDELLEISFTIENRAAANIEFEFSSSQLFDLTAATFAEQNANNIVWNWSNDKIFAQAVNYSTLEAGKSRTFQTTWDCTGNTGERLAGVFYLTGQLVAIPGGKSAPVCVTIE